MAHANQLLDLNDVPLDVILKKNIEEDMVNVWKIVQECTLQMVLLGTPNCDYTYVKVNRTRPYNYVNWKAPTKIFERTSSLVPYWIGIDQAAFLSKIGTEHCCSKIFVCQISFQLIVECFNKLHSMNGNSRRHYVINSRASNAPIAKEGDKKKEVYLQ